MRNAALLSLLLVACAGSSATRTQYLLRSEPAERTGRVEATAHVGLGQVAVAPYLDQSGIVVETEPGQVRAARLHQWAEPLDAGLRSFLRTELSKALGEEVSGGAGRSQWLYTVNVYVDRLHGSMAGSAEIDASFRITPKPGDGDVAEFRFSRSASLPREGYPGLVEAEADLVRQLAHAIAASLREVRQASMAP
jgi:uncharacterized lipoprotein YmbA